MLTQFKLKLFAIKERIPFVFVEKLRISFLICYLLLFTNNTVATVYDNNDRLREIVTSWASAHTNKNFELFKKLYYHKVEFYTQNMNEDNCVKLKRKNLDGNVYFSLVINSKITIKKLRENLYKCSFDKKAISRNFEKTYPSYLVIFKENNDFFIVGESDLITDKNLKYNFNVDRFPTSVDSGKAGSNSKIVAKEEPEESSSGIIFDLSIFILVLAILLYFIIRLNRKIGEKTKIDKKSSEITIEKNSKKNEYLNIGHEFEKFIINKFDQKYFKLLTWQGDKTTNGVIPVSNSHPDLIYLFTHKSFSRKFAVECKFRTNISNKIVNIASQRQITNYKEFAIKEGTVVYIVVGLQGTPQNPTEIFIIPLSEVTEKMDYDLLKTFARSTTNRFFYDMYQEKLT
jgi:hypothetical protein